jgi:hypothetical protein
MSDPNLKKMIRGIVRKDHLIALAKNRCMTVNTPDGQEVKLQLQDNLLFTIIDTSNSESDYIPLPQSSLYGSN